MNVPAPRPSTSSGRTGRGFTLIELMIAAGITTVVFAAVAVTTAGGLAAWRTAESLSRMTQEGTKVLRALEQDLTTALASETFLFEGRRAGLSCTVSRQYRPMKVSWAVSEGTWSREARWLTAEGTAAPEPVPPHRWRAVETIAFEYPIAQDGAVTWVETWPAEQATTLPSAVRVTVGLLGPRDHRLTLTRTIGVPAGRLDGAPGA